MIKQQQPNKMRFENNNGTTNTNNNLMKSDVNFEDIQKGNNYPSKISVVIIYPIQYAV